jgi:hypothetical protein
MVVCGLYCEIGRLYSSIFACDYFCFNDLECISIWVNVGEIGVCL